MRKFKKHNRFYFFLFEIKREFKLKKNKIKKPHIKSKMFYFSISFCFCLVTASWACTGLQTRRTCTCKAIYTFENQPNEEKTLNLPLDGYDDCGINIGCQKELDCSSYCLRQISEVLGGNRTYFTQSGQDKTCLLIMNTQSLIENGIVLWSHWTYSGCQTGKNLIISGLCCGRRCSCEIGKDK